MKNILMKVKLMAMATGTILVLIVVALTAMYSQVAFALKPTTLTLDASPSVASIHDSHKTLPVSLSGELTSGGSPISGATIHLGAQSYGVPVESLSVTTNEFGIYKTSVNVGPGQHYFRAHFEGDSEHQSSFTTKEINVHCFSCPVG